MTPVIRARLIWAGMAVAAAIAVALLIFSPGTGRAFDSVYCGHGFVSYSGRTVSYQEGYTSGGVHYHTYGHTGWPGSFHYQTIACGSVPRR